MLVLVTGAAGFLGVRLVERLVSHGYEVKAFGRGPIPEQFVSNDSITWIDRDIAQDGVSPEETEGIDTFFHLAGATLGAGQDEYRFLMANELTIVRLLQACAKHTKRFIFASSQAVYGDANHIAVTEEFPLRGLDTAYACSKYNCENWLRWFQKKHGGQYIALRLSGFIEGGGIVDYIIDRALRNEPIELYSKGEVQRDYLPVEKGIEAFVAALHYKSLAGFESFNIGSGQALSSLKLAKLICAEAHSSSEIILSTNDAPQGNFVFDISKAKRYLGFNSGELADAVRQYLLQKKNVFERGVLNA